MMINQDVTHPTTTCDECQTKGFRGVRWKCTQCFNYDLCDECYKGNKHFLDHVFLKIVKPLVEGVITAPRSRHPVNSERSQATRQEQQIVTHPTITCDACKTEGIVGVRWQCIHCVNYDLCEVCYNSNKHSVDHKFRKIISPGVAGVIVSPRSEQPISSDQIRPVQSAVDTHTTTTCDECQVEGFRGVRWKCTQCIDYDLCDQCYKDGKHSLDHVFFKIVKPGAKRIVVPPRSHNQLMSDQSLAPNCVKHPFITCDECNTDGITGVRWKCTQCTDYDLCDGCYHGNKHSLDHKFWKIPKPGSERILTDARSLNMKQEHKSDIEIEDIIRRVVELDIPEEMVRQVVAAKQTIPAFTSVEELTSAVLASLGTSYTGSAELTSETGNGVVPAATDAGNDDRLQCKVCLDAECEMTFVPCGHLVCCSECAEGMKACPICRADIQCQIRTYLS